MPTFLRCLAASAVLALSMIGVATPATAAPPECAGVWVVVQPDEADPSTATVRCATEFGTGLEALQSAGYGAESSGSMLSRIDGQPENGDFTTNGGYYWSYWSAPMNADGTIGEWTYYQVGADTSKPESGKVEGWLLTKDQAPKGPALSVLPEQVATSSASPAPGASQDGPPAGLIVGVVVVVLAVAGVTIWWWLKRRAK